MPKRICTVSRARTKRKKAAGQGMPKSMAPKESAKFSDRKVKATISMVKEGKISNASLNERVLTEKQKEMLKKVGWKRIQATETMSYWQSPKQKSKK